MRGLVLCLLLLAAGCALPLTREFTDPNQPIVVRRGEEFVITLDSNATTGNRWELAQPLDEKIVTLLDQEYVTSGPPIPGAGGQEHWTFKAVGPGTTQLALAYKRANQNPTAGGGTARSSARAPTTTRTPVSP